MRHSEIFNQRYRRPARAAVSLCCLALSLASAAAAQTPLDGSEGPAAERAEDVIRLETVQQREVSLQQAIEMAQQRQPGRVVRAETKVEDGRRVHEIRILADDGRVRTIRIDAGGAGR